MQRLIILAFCCAVISCNNSNPKPTTDPAAVKNDAVPVQPKVDHPLAGNWVGFLGDNKVNINLQSIEGNKVSGKSIAAGNYRDINGTIEENADGYTLHLTEPGDDKYDGVFDFTVKKNGMVCTGAWKPNDKTLKEKMFTASKKAFVYDPNAGLYPEASNRELKEDDVADLIKSDLRMMRNAMYARHGYSFKMKDVRAEFDRESWYIPVSTDVRNELTPLEKKNEVLIKRFEKYAAEYYDDFGR